MRQWGLEVAGSLGSSQSQHAGLQSLAQLHGVLCTHACTYLMLYEHAVRERHVTTVLFVSAAAG